jgi:hypothetical protein
MQGLSYCVQHAVSGFSTVLGSYGCSLASLFSGGRRFEPCEASLRPFAKAAVTRSEIHRQSLAAPFWKSGGTLYIHTILPHPPGPVAGHTLEADYEENLKQAATLAEDLLVRLEIVFGENFLLVVTSDHPLRPAVWCGPFRYAERECAQNARFSSAKVPLIAVGQGSPGLMDLDNNLDLLSRMSQHP